MILNFLKTFILSRQFVLAPLTVSLILAIVMFSGISSAAEPDYTSQKVIRAVNDERGNFHLFALATDPRLQTAAFNKASHLLTNDYFDHHSPAGVSPWDFILFSGFDYRFAGENLALNYTDPQEVVQAWMASGSHRRNVLNANFDRVGVGVAEGELNGKNATVTVLMLGKERTVRPSLFDSSVVEIVKNILNIK